MEPALSREDMVKKAREALNRNDYAVALALFRKAADQGSSPAQMTIGWMYDAGKGVPQDHAQALFWYRKAADQGDAGAQYNLAAHYHLNDEYAQAMQWYRKAADQGVALAQFQVGTFYRAGRGVPRDDAQALAWFRKAADQGLGFAQFEIGVMYLAGEGVPLNYGTAMSWFRKAADDSTAGLHPVHDLDKINRSKSAAAYAIGRMRDPRGSGSAASRARPAKPDAPIPI